MLKNKFTLSIFAILIGLPYCSNAQNSSVTPDFSARNKEIMPVQNVNTVKGLVSILKNSTMDSTCNLVCYNLLVIPTKNDPYEIKSMGRGCAANMKNRLALLQAGDMVFLTNVLIECPNTKIAQSVANRTFLLK
jgi:hypothetical protein